VHSIIQGGKKIIMVKARRGRWLEHLERLEDTCPCKTLNFTKPEGIRSTEKDLQYDDEII
jgi:hypothetical protein